MIIKEAEQLTVVTAGSREQMGTLAAEAVYHKIHELLNSKEFINMIFAAAPSQNEFFAALVDKDIDWSRVNAFHMDEYIGLSPNAPQGFGNFLREKIFDKKPFRKFII